MNIDQHQWYSFCQFVLLCMIHDHFQGFDDIFGAQNSFLPKHPFLQPLLPPSSIKLNKLYLYYYFYLLTRITESYLLAVLCLKSYAFTFYAYFFLSSLSTTLRGGLGSNCSFRNYWLFTVGKALLWYTLNGALLTSLDCLKILLSFGLGLFIVSCEE